MTEADWQSCTDPEKMLRFLGEKASARKLRLFAVACCRRAWERFPLDDDLSRSAIDVAERFADGLATDEEVIDIADQMHYGVPGHLNAACRAIHSNFDFGYGDLGSALRCPYGIEPAISCAIEASGDYRVQGVLARTVAEIIVEANYQCELVRDIFDPFSTCQPIDPMIRAFDDGIIVKLAEAAYQERTLPSGELEPARLAVLADALEEAGYVDEELLHHLREPRVHVRGCLAIDFLLGKS